MSKKTFLFLSGIVGFVCLCLPWLSAPGSFVDTAVHLLETFRARTLSEVFITAPLTFSAPTLLLGLKILSLFPTSAFLFKLPLILSHILLSYFVFGFSRRANGAGKISQRGYFILCLSVLLNPVLIYLTAVVCDPWIVALLFLTAYLWGLHEDKPSLAGIALALALGLKPQTIVALPMLFFLNSRWKVFAATLITLLVLHLPFFAGDVSALFRIYPYSFRAYFSGIVLGSPSGLITQLIPSFTLAAISAGLFFLARSGAFKTKTFDKYCAITVVIGLFVQLLSPRLPEGSGLALLPFFFFFFLRSKPNFTVYAVFSLNLWVDVLDFVDALYYSSRNLTESSPYGLFTLLIKLGVLGYLFNKQKENASEKEWKPDFDFLTGTPLTKLKDRLPTPFIFQKPDYGFLAVITCAALLLNFYDLGSRKIPQSVATWGMTSVEFNSTEAIAGVWVFDGKGEGWINFSCAGGAAAKYELRDYYTWKYTPFPVPCTSSIVISGPEKGEVHEVFFRGVSGKQIFPSKICVNQTSGFIDSPSSVPATCASDTSPLFDEPSLAPARPSYRDGSYFDEIYFPRTAHEILDGDSIYETSHPPLGKALIAGSVKLLGRNPFAWRALGAILGALFPALLFFFARLLFGTRAAAYAAGFLSLFDFARVSLSRLSTPQIQTDLWSCLVFFFLFLFLRRRVLNETKFRQDVPFLFLSGLFWGFGISTKWLAVYGIAGVFFLLFVVFWLDKQNRKNYVLYSFLAFVVLPLSVYLLSYLSYLHAGYNTLPKIINHQKSMYFYHSLLTAKDSFSSRFFSWPFLNRPHWIYLLNSLSENIRGTIVVIGNPAIWWLVLPSIGYLLYQPRYRLHSGILFCLLAFFSLYSPWIFIGRILYVYHFHPALPFGILCLSFLFSEFQTRYRRWTMAYLVLVFGLFVWFWPALTGFEVSPQYIHNLRWFRSWFF